MLLFRHCDLNTVSLLYFYQHVKELLYLQNKLSKATRLVVNLITVFSFSLALETVRS